MTDLTQRLRELADCDSRAGEPLGRCMREAADALDVAAQQLAAKDAEIAALADDNARALQTITALSDENARLRDQLRAAEATFQMAATSGAFHAAHARNTSARMSELVEAAYREGFDAAPAWTVGDEDYYDMQTRLWGESKARAALAGKE